MLICVRFLIYRFEDIVDFTAEILRITTFLQRKNRRVQRINELFPFIGIF